MNRFRSSVMLAVVGVVVSLSACGGSAAPAGPSTAVTWYPSTPLPSPGQALPSPSVAAATAAAPAGVGQGQSSGLGTPVANISATNKLAFDPTTVTVKTGAVIQWKDTGSTAHNVTFDGQSSLTSGTLQQGNTWQVQFTTAGTYKYHCTFHPGMDGQITVTG
ncbi:MAG: cupredoxin domain-containing protein [Candidatus Dormibacteria bacterium]